MWLENRFRGDGRLGAERQVGVTCESYAYDVIVPYTVS